MTIPWGYWLCPWQRRLTDTLGPAVYLVTSIGWLDQHRHTSPATLLLFNGRSELAKWLDFPHEITIKCFWRTSADVEYFKEKRVVCDNLDDGAERSPFVCAVDLPRCHHRTWSTGQWTVISGVHWSISSHSSFDLVLICFCPQPSGDAVVSPTVWISGLSFHSLYYLLFCSSACYSLSWLSVLSFSC